MADAGLHRRIEAATAYHDVLVPALFEAWAPRVAGAAPVRPGDRVLDVACGTGVLAREAAARAGPGGVVAGLDIDAGMIAVAARLSPTLGWHRGNAESLPFPAASFDVVLSQFGLMLVPDAGAALREMARVLVPGGRLAVAVWASLDDTPLYIAEVALLERLAGLAAGAALRAAFALGDPARLAKLFVDAGIPDVSIALQAGTGRFASIRAIVEADLRGWLPMRGVELSEDTIALILREADEALGPHVVVEDGGVRFASPALIATATGPAEGSRGSGAGAKL